MDDPRITGLLNAARAMLEGRCGPLAVAAGDDDTARLASVLEQIGHELKGETQEKRTLLEITARINHGSSVDDVMDYAYSALRGILPFDRIGLALLQPGGMVHSRWVRSEASVVELERGYRAPLAGSSLETIVRTGEPRILNDLKAHLEAHPTSAATRLLLEEGMRSSLTCPLVAMGKPVGFMFFSSMRPGTYSGAHVAFFRQIAGQVSVAVEKASILNELREASDLKSRLLGMVAHDLRNPAAVIKMYLHMLLKGELGPLAEEQSSVLAELEHANDRMVRLLGSVLDVRAIEAGKLELRVQEVEVGPYLRSCLVACHPAARPRSITIVVEAEPGLPRLRLDPDRVEQVVYNLVYNAIKFCRVGGMIAVRARTEGSAVAVDVEDDGPGLRPEDLPRLFTEFGKGTRDGSSVGLGLAIAKSMVLQHGGEIRAANRPEGGARFTFLLPVPRT